MKFDRRHWSSVERDSDGLLMCSPEWVNSPAHPHVDGDMLAENRQFCLFAATHYYNSRTPLKEVGICLRTHARLRRYGSR